MRRLPGSGGQLIDDKNLPKDVVAFNPSIAYPYIYLRGNKQTPLGEENFILMHNEKTNTTDTIDNLGNILQKNTNRYKGLEDLRICHFQNNLWFTATSTHANVTMNSELVIGHFDTQVKRIEKISHVDLGRPPVKNVCPFVYDSKLCLLDIYQKKLYTVESKNDDKGKWIQYVATNFKNISCGAGLDIDNFRGSTSPIHLHGTIYGCVVHDVIFNDSPMQNVQLAYMHHWIEIDMHSGQVTFVSTPFWVVTFGVEFISGIHKVEQKEGQPCDRIDIYMGVHDKVPYKFETRVSYLRVGKL
jgi:hypothetical protein